jgi:transcriptional regulator with XRE-family HTH domain
MATALAMKLKKIQAQTGLQGPEIAELLEISPQTVWRWANAKVMPQRDQLERVLDLSWIAERLGELYSPDEAKVWLYSRHQLLGGRRPVDLIEQADVDPILKIIDQLDSGAYA